MNRGRISTSGGAYGKYQRYISAVIIISVLVLSLAGLAGCGEGQQGATDQEPETQLTPEERAVETVTSFIEVCRRGQGQKAWDEYRFSVTGIEDLPAAIPAAIYSSTSYEVAYIGTGVLQLAPMTPEDEEIKDQHTVAVTITTTGGEETNIVFNTTKSGDRIYSMYIDEDGAIPLQMNAPS